jgi:hypothetical protein
MLCFRRQAGLWRTRKVGRAVECTGLEIRRVGNGTVSSNLTPSAISPGDDSAAFEFRAGARAAGLTELERARDNLSSDTSVSRCAHEFAYLMARLNP